MARKAHPWFWEERQLWCVNKDGKRHTLGEHPEGAPKPTQSRKTGLWNTPDPIMEVYGRLMGAPVGHAPRSGFLSAYLQKFLTWDKQHRAPRCRISAAVAMSVS